MRAFLNAILAFIGSESLTDEEFDDLPEGLEQAYSKATYDALRGVLISRETISMQGTRLKAYFVARGLDLSGESARVPSSQILIGGALD